MVYIGGLCAGFSVLVDGSILEFLNLETGSVVARAEANRGTVTACALNVYENTIYCALGTSDGGLYAVWIRLCVDLAAPSSSCSSFGEALEAITVPTFRLEPESHNDHCNWIILHQDYEVNAIQSIISREASYDSLGGLSGWVAARANGDIHFFTLSELVKCRTSTSSLNRRDLGAFLPTTPTGTTVGHGDCVTCLAVKEFTPPLGEGERDTADGKYLLAAIEDCFWCTAGCTVVLGWKSGRVTSVDLPSCGRQSSGMSAMTDTTTTSTGADVATTFFGTSYGVSIARLFVDIDEYSHDSETRASLRLVVCLQNGITKCLTTLAFTAASSTDMHVTTVDAIYVLPAVKPGTDMCHRLAVERGLLIYAASTDGCVYAAALSLHCDGEVLGEVDGSTAAKITTWTRVRDCKAGRAAATAVYARDGSLVLSFAANGRSAGAASFGMPMDVRLRGAVGWFLGSPSSALPNALPAMEQRIANVVAEVQYVSTTVEALEHRLEVVDGQLWWLTGLCQLAGIRQRSGSDGRNDGGQLQQSLAKLISCECWASASTTMGAVNARIRLRTDDARALSALQGHMLSVSCCLDDEHSTSTVVPLVFTSTGDANTDGEGQMFECDAHIAPLEVSSLRPIRLNIAVTFSSLDLALVDSDAAIHTKSTLAESVPIVCLTLSLAQIMHALAGAGAACVKGSLLGSLDQVLLLGLPPLPDPTAPPRGLSAISDAASGGGGGGGIHLSTGERVRSAGRGRIPFHPPSFRRQGTLPSVAATTNGSSSSSRRRQRSQERDVPRVWQDGAGVRRVQCSSAAVLSAAHAVACQDTLDGMPSVQPAAAGFEPTAMRDIFSASDAYALPVPLQQALVECMDLLWALEEARQSESSKDGAIMQEQQQQHWDALGTLWRLYVQVRNAVC